MIRLLPLQKGGWPSIRPVRPLSIPSLASCHPDGHTDHQLWVLDTPHLAGADQIEPRLSQTLRGLRGTAPYHWDGVPGDPYGGLNASKENTWSLIVVLTNRRRGQTCDRLKYVEYHDCS